MEIPHEERKNIYRAVLVFIIVLVLFFAVKFLSEVRMYQLNMGMGTSSITVAGHGEVKAVPDIANVYFTIRKEAKTVKEAQSAVAEIEKKALDFLKEKKVEEKDFQTTNSSFNPKFEYRYDYKSSMPCTPYGCPPRGRDVIVGYQAYESITVKVRNTDDVGAIMEGLGTLGVEELSGPNFIIDDEEGLKAEARKLAIEDAKEKAKVLAKDLGVRIVRINYFQDDTNAPYPMAYGGDSMMMEGKSSMNQAVSAEIPKGENTITSDISITYEIR